MGNCVDQCKYFLIKIYFCYRVIASHESSFTSFEYSYYGCLDSLDNVMTHIISTPNLLTRGSVNECAATGSNAICSTADNYCADNVESIYDEVLNRDEYDIREFDPDP